MEAVAALLKGLPLQPEESDRGDLMEAKSQMFLKKQDYRLTIFPVDPVTSPELESRDMKVMALSGIATSSGLEC
ncbi:hypothetical protein BC332_34769 [Capsicum chinense]|nr:hypothetical protein BC332_34769 [Capsicum chinense]